ncbi:MAG: hypothetical protein AAFW84_12375 [Cyanobacteria bacterium J06635_15]
MISPLFESALPILPRLNQTHRSAKPPSRLLNGLIELRVDGVENADDGLAVLDDWQSVLDVYSLDWLVNQVHSSLFFSQYSTDSLSEILSAALIQVEDSNVISRYGLTDPGDTAYGDNRGEWLNALRWPLPLTEPALLNRVSDAQAFGQLLGDRTPTSQGGSFNLADPGLDLEGRNLSHSRVDATNGDQEVIYQVGAAQADITPADWQERTYWLAGFNADRPALDVHDPLYARSLIIDDGITPTAIVTLDLLGVVSDDVDRIQAAIAARVPELTDHILVHSTHNHEGPDTIGLWGGVGDIPFLNPRPSDYIDAIATQAANAVETAWANRQPASLTVANIDNTVLSDLVQDVRLPNVSDPFARLMVFSADDQVVGTLVNWASHPEVLGARNQAMTADFTKWVIDEMEANLGGPALFVNGAIGGLLTSSGDEILPDLPSESFEKAEAIGREIAQRLLQQLQNPRPTDRVETFTTLPPITHQQREFYLPVENPIFLGAKLVDQIPTTLYHQLVIPPEERWRSILNPLAFSIETEANFLTMGPVSITTMGGELYPQLLMGGIDPSIGVAPYNTTPLEVPLVDNPTLDDYTYQFFFGLTNDFHGYVLPQAEWDGWFEGLYGEEFSTSADGGTILSYNMHLLMLGYETREYPTTVPDFLIEPDRKRPSANGNTAAAIQSQRMLSPSEWDGLAPMGSLPEIPLTANSQDAIAQTIGHEIQLLEEWGHGLDASPPDLSDLAMFEHGLGMASLVPPDILPFSDEVSSALAI